ncbi:MAG: AlwI family type II restriction endonuclease [Clostridia bacterium]|nr:AlwI family type II restriction endonuclease [Clostridia bacterium]
MPSYKSYCWSLGTTSFRMVEFNRKIEQQLKLLNDFWDIPQYQNQNWSANNTLQVAYYEFIKAQGFIEDKDAPRKDKDAREKTSGLVDLGLINAERRLTSAGQALLDISQSGIFEDDNLLQIPADSFIYFKQLLKLSCPFEEGHVRPYAILAYMLAELGEISKEEFTYLLPLAINRNKMDMIINYIREIRNGGTTIDEAITSVLSEMDNYRIAKTMFNNAPVIDDIIIQEIGMNRKSRSYDIPYTELYRVLDVYRSYPEDGVAYQLFKAVIKISGKASLYWKKYLFNTSLESVVKRDGAATVNRVALFRTTSNEEFRNEFFRLLHLFKAKSLLDDYYDLNKRYFKTSDTVLFKDDIVKFDIIPNCYFSLVKDSLLGIAFTQATNLFSVTNLADMGLAFDIKQEQLFEKAEELYGVQVRNLYDIQGFVDRERYTRLNQMIDEKFTDEILIKLMTHFENRDDKDIQTLVTNNADVPTIFEYVLAIAWYKISGRQGKVLEYMNLSLDADLLPITHAAGGHEDITYKYEATENYPAHTLLIEATLAGGTNQRRMEMEPVSRHLGDYLLNHTEEAYCIFATTFLHVNVVADFRGRKFMPYYSSDGARSVNGMKIVPCNTEEIKTIIQRGITYAQLYRVFEEAHQANTAPNLWYDQEIKNKL